MALRADALAGAAEFILAVEALARARPPLVATVGRISAHPGAANVIAGSAELSLDVRHPVDARRLAACASPARGRPGDRGEAGLLLVMVTQDNGAVAVLPGADDAPREERARAGESRPRWRAARATTPWSSPRSRPSPCSSSAAGAASATIPDEFVHPKGPRAALGIVVDFLGRLASRKFE
jgi:allantoate deiminase